MAAPRNNKNAVGNIGRRPKEQEKQIIEFKGLVLAEAIKIMKKGTPQQKKELISRSITSVLPRTIEGPEDDGGFVVKVLNYAGDNNSTST